MTKRLEYIVIAVTVFIFTLYHAVLTSLVIATIDSLELSFGYIFWVETAAFLPLGIGMVVIMWIGKISPKLFTELSYTNLIKHILIASTLFTIHAFWQPLMNATFFGDVFSFSSFTRDFVLFLQMRFLVYVIIVGLVSGIIKIREQQQIIIKESELNLKLQKARLKELELKMNPEIIYPNLGFIKDKTIENPEEASQMVILMAGILRRLVDNIEDEKVKISDEISFFRMYADLIKLRLENPFEVDVKVSEHLEDEKVPSMILIIPMLEKLFFGEYSDDFKEVDKLVFSARRISKNKIEETITIKHLSNIHEVSKKLESEQLIDKINQQLVELAKGEFTFKTQLNETGLVLRLVSQQQEIEVLYE